MDRERFMKLMDAETRNMDRIANAAEYASMQAARDAAKLLRAEAYARGDKTYSPGFPCRHGHVADRYVSTNGCSACLRYLRVPKIGRGQQFISMGWLTRTDLQGDINTLKCYLTECFVKYFESTGDGEVLDAGKLAQMRATGRPYGE